MDRVIVMDFLVRVTAGERTGEYDLARILKRAKTIREGLKITALAILAEGLDCDVEIVDEPN